MTTLSEFDENAIIENAILMNQQNAKKKTKKKSSMKDVISILATSVPTPTKKKNSKLITKVQEPVAQTVQLGNIILHLKCTNEDLEEYTRQNNEYSVSQLYVYNPNIPQILTYNAHDENMYTPFISDTSTTIIPVNNDNAYSDINTSILCEQCRDRLKPTTSVESIVKEGAVAEEEVDTELTEISYKDLCAKLKRLKTAVYKNILPDKKSACFWCTCEFDNPACYIPRNENDKGIFAYGCFCRPECAVAFLMNESIDDSMRFERYHLLNQIYSKIYGYKKNIRPAPSPYYLLDKYFGTLTAQEYRKLLKSEHMLLVIEKPMTRVLPEIHEENDETILNMSGQKHLSTGTYKVKRQSEKVAGPTKNTIMKETFNLL